MASASLPTSLLLLCCCACILPCIRGQADALAPAVETSSIVSDQPATVSPGALDAPAALPALHIPGRVPRLHPLVPPVQAFTTRPEDSPAAPTEIPSIVPGPLMGVTLGRHLYGSAAAAAAAGMGRVAEERGAVSAQGSCSSSYCSYGGNTCYLKPLGGCGVKIRYSAPKSYTNSAVQVMRAPKLVPMFYGSWTDAQKAIVFRFITYMGGSSWFGITGLYSDMLGWVPNTSAMYAGQSVNFTAADVATYGTTLSNSQVQSLIALGIRRLTNTATDTGGSSNLMYMLLTGPDINQVGSSTSAFCTQYCGWHTYYTQSSGSVPVKYLWVGNAATRCPSSCSMGVAPNGDAGIDGMLSVIAHEIAETASDPLINAWKDSQGSENADLCAWQFGSIPSGQQWNVQFADGSQYYLQLNLNPKTGLCIAGV